MQSDFCQSEHQPLKNDTGTQRKDANRVSIRGKRVRNNLQEGVQVKVTNNLQAYLAKLESQSKTLHVLQLHLCYMAASLFHFSCHLLSIQQFPKSLFLYFLLLILQYCTFIYSQVILSLLLLALFNYWNLCSLILKELRELMEIFFLKPSFPCKLGLQTFIHSSTHSTISLVQEFPKHFPLYLN